MYVCISYFYAVNMEYHIFLPNVEIALQSSSTVMICCLSSVVVCECNVTKRLQVESHIFIAKQINVPTFRLVSLITKLEENSSIGGSN